MVWYDETFVMVETPSLPPSLPSS